MLKKCSSLLRAALMVAVLLMVCGAVGYFGVSSQQQLFIPVDAAFQTDEFTASKPGVVSCEAADDGVVLLPLGAGRTDIMAGDEVLASVTCGPNGFIYDLTNGSYNGSEWVKGTVLVFLTGTVIILITMLRRQMRTAFFHYATPLLMAFVLLTALMLVWVVINQMLQRPSSL